MSTMQKRLQQEIQTLQEQYLYRSQQIVFEQAGMSRHHSDWCDFSSNDYLGLSNDPRLIASFSNAAARYGIGSGGSPLLGGYSGAHAELEQQLCSYTKRPRALLFGSGYLANLALVTTFASRRNTTILMDKLCHASLIDAGRLAQARLRRYPHQSLADIEKYLQQDSVTLLVTEGVFSMEGDMSPLAEIAALVSAGDTLFAVDDAHGFGVLGDSGAGSCSQQGVTTDEVPLIMATFGKAIGCHGAFIAGSDAAIELLLQRGRSYIYATAFPAALAATVSKSLQLCAKEQWRRDKLQENIQQFRTGCKELGIALVPSTTPIQAILVTGNRAVLECGQYMREHKIYAGIIRSPTVAKGAERIRISISAQHSEADINNLLLVCKDMQQRGFLSAGHS